MEDCGPWPLEEFTYLGLCSHSALEDCIQGNFGMTQEDVQDVETRQKEKAKTYNAKHYKRMRDTDLEGYQARVRDSSARYREQHPDKVKANQKRSKDSITQKKKFYCDICGQECVSQWELDRHNGSRRHKLAVQRSENGKSRFYCSICGTQLTRQCHLNRHNNG